MKIAIVGGGFTGATLPLANHLTQSGYQTDCYYFTRIGSSAIESLDFDKPLKAYKSLYRIVETNKLYKYLTTSVGVYIIPICRRHRLLEAFLVGRVALWFNYFRVRKFINFLLKQHYDYVMLIDQSKNEHQVGKALKRANIPFFTMYHEILTDLVHPAIRLDVLESLKFGTPIVVHSEKTRADLLHFVEDKEIASRINVIRFGPFDSYTQYGQGSMDLDLKKGYLLFLGRIAPYKGLHLLYDAINLIPNSVDVKVVIAGIGSDAVLQNMQADKRYVIINRFIKNEEVVWLVRNCRAVVCPYIATSQSGVPALAMAFGKPIIATPVGAFPEIIRDGQNGFLAEKPTPVEMASTIRRCIQKGSYPVSIPLDMNWSYVSSQYINIISESINIKA